MCFTPWVSLSTFLFEFLIAIIILIFFKKSKINLFFVSFLFVLGIYQSTEFMLCIFNNPLLWAKIGFITYTFLPALGLYYILRIAKINKKSYRLYPLFLVPLFFSLIALLTKNFILSAQCSKFFVEVHTMLFSYPALFYTYVVYYFGFLLLMTIILWSKMIKERNKIQRRIEIDILAAIILSILPPVILILIIPSLNKMFPSIYCGFAVLFAFAAIISVYLRKKKHKE